MQRSTKRIDLPIHEIAKRIGRGYPDGAQFAAKQAALHRDIRARYDALVSEILATSREFAEVVE